MARRSFYSFHYRPDNWRASQVRNMGAIDGNPPVSDNDWEQVTRGGDAAIERWIDQQMNGRSCVVVLIGSQTANRKWINHEIIKGWNAGKGVVGVHVHNLQDRNQKQSAKGTNPFDHVTFTNSGKPLSSVVKTYDPPHFDSKAVYGHINSNLAKWVEEAIEIRGRS